MTTTFDFGFGSVPAHKHPNGGGWVADSATVAGTAYVGPGALVSGEAQVSGNALVSGEAQVSGNARVSGNALVSGNARVSRTPIVIQGAEFPVTIVDAPLVCVGCKVATLEQWETGHAPEECPRLEAMRPFLIGIAKLHHAQEQK